MVKFAKICCSSNQVQNYPTRIVLGKAKCLKVQEAVTLKSKIASCLVLFAVKYLPWELLFIKTVFLFCAKAVNDFTLFWLSQQLSMRQAASLCSLVLFMPVSPGTP